MFKHRHEDLETILRAQVFRLGAATATAAALLGHSFGYLSTDFNVRDSYLGDFPRDKNSGRHQTGVSAAEPLVTLSRVDP
jgi:hypothetical protein